MIDPKYALMQVERFAKLNWYPGGRGNNAARSELVQEAGRANSLDVLASVCASWLESEVDCPKPADLRRLISVANGDTVKRSRDCSDCGGTGSTVGYYLITYKGNSFVVVNREFMPDVKDQQHAYDFAALLKDVPGSKNQTVLSGAVACHCAGGNR